MERRVEERSRGQDRKVEEMNARERGLDKREALGVGRNWEAGDREAGPGATGQAGADRRPHGSEEARREILQRVEDEARGQAAALVRDIKEQAKKTADRDARIIALATQRLAAEYTAESTVAAVPLPATR